MRKEEICLYVDVQAYVRWVGKKERGGGGVGREEEEGRGWLGKEGGGGG